MSDMLTINGHGVNVGTKVTFNSINTYDPSVWLGVVLGIATYDIAKTFFDVDKYHAEVVKDPAYVGPMQASGLEQYLILETVDDGKPSRKVACAIEWIEGLSLVDVTTTATFRIYDIPETSIQAALDHIASGGYKADYIG